MKLNLDANRPIYRQIMDEMYRPLPDGLCGNDDCGQMSAWYILSAIGFYPVNPAEGIYVIGFFYPVVPKGKARIRVQVSAAHTTEMLDRAIAAFGKVGKELGSAISEFRKGLNEGQESDQEKTEA